MVLFEEHKFLASVLHEEDGVLMVAIEQDAVDDVVDDELEDRNDVEFVDGIWVNELY